MSLRMQLIRAAAALAIIGSVGAAESLLPTATGSDCPFAKAARPQRILLLDPIQRHPIWIDARGEPSDEDAVHSSADASHASTAHGVVTS